MEKIHQEKIDVRYVFTSIVYRLFVLECPISKKVELLNAWLRHWQNKHLVNVYRIIFGEEHLGNSIIQVFIKIRTTISYGIEIDLGKDMFTGSKLIYMDEKRNVNLFETY